MIYEGDYIDGYRLCPEISSEWAKQLIHDSVDIDVLANLDFGSIKVITYPMCYQYRVAVYPNKFSCKLEELENCHEDIYPKKVIDPINKEVHYIAYGIKSNTAIVVILTIGDLKKIFRGYAL